MFKVFGGLWKKIMFSFLKDIWGVTKKVVWSIVLLCQMTFASLEQELENFNLDEVCNKEPLGSENNPKEEE